MEVVHMKIRNSVLCIMIICVFVLFNSDGAFGGSPNAPLNRELLAKAQPDECFHGIGVGYDPDPTCSSGNGVPKVNQAYVWGLTKNGPKVWWGTVANMVCVVGGMLLDASPIQLDSMQTTAWVCEYGNSLYPPAASLPDGMGDWRPPKVYSYDTAGRTQEDKTPADPLIFQTWGLRSAGTVGDVVFLAGPGLGPWITMFAFKSSTGHFLGAQQFPQYTDIREWLTADGVLYAGVQNQNGSGSVIRWTGDETNPFPDDGEFYGFKEVGRLDASAANLAYHDGKIFVNTWPSVDQMFGGNVLTSLYMSPEIPCGGLPPSGVEWNKVWKITDYEPDWLANRYQMGGALRSYKGSLYWGTMLIPVVGLLYATQALDLDANGNGEIDIEELLTTLVGTHRSVTLFRGKGFGTKYQKMQVLYGEKYLPVYDPVQKKYTFGFDAAHRNRMPDPVPKYGHAGFNNPFNTYIWSMGVYDNKLFIGTFDWSYLFYQGLVDMAIRPSFPELADKLTGLAKMKPPFKDFPIQFGADLYKFVNSNSSAKAESRDGVGNFSNYGVRTLVGDETGLYVGTANAMNLLTDPFDDLPEGGWELLRLTK
jgi:hypothetical protein